MAANNIGTERERKWTSSNILMSKVHTAYFKREARMVDIRDPQSFAVAHAEDAFPPN